VTRDDLHEIREFGWLQQSLIGVGAFFCGAFWLLIELASHQEKFEFTVWMVLCTVSIFFGLVLMGLGLRLITLKQRRLDKYFPARDDESTSS
jgi:hypothetical protein